MRICLAGDFSARLTVLKHPLRVHLGGTLILVFSSEPTQRRARQCRQPNDNDEEHQAHDQVSECCGDGQAQTPYRQYYKSHTGRQIGAQARTFSKSEPNQNNFSNARTTPSSSTVRVTILATPFTSSLASPIATPQPAWRINSRSECESPKLAT